MTTSLRSCKGTVAGTSRLFKSLFFSLSFFSFFILPIDAFADGDTPVAKGLSYIITAMYGTTGVALATIAVIAVGLLCLAHILEWKRLIQTVVGIAIIFGAGAIVSAIQYLAR